MPPLPKLPARWPQRLRRLGTYCKQEIVGLAQDFWQDGDWRKTTASAADEDFEHRDKPGQSRHTDLDDADGQGANDKPEKNLWRALPGEISEKMWGQGFVTPGDDYIGERLIGPLGVTKDMSLLDLSAGLGGRLRKTVEIYGAYITGLEPDPGIAARGRELSVKMGLSKHADITPYDPMNLTTTRKYDCVIARETIYRVADKENFIAAMIKGCKSKAQFSFTDYVVNPEARERPAIRAWRAFEVGAAPLGLVEMAGIWAKFGVTLRVHDDMTDFYKAEVKKGLARFADFMTSGITPDAETKRSINKRILTWAHRMAAIDQGMRFYRFYGLRGRSEIDASP